MKNHSKKHSVKLSYYALVSALLLTLSGCEKIKANYDQSKNGNQNDKGNSTTQSTDNKAKAEKAPSQSAPQRPAPVVDVITAKAETVIRTVNLPARLQASRTAVIVPRASGIVEKRLFNEGEFVKAGQPLYQLDKGNFLAALQTAEGNLRSVTSQITTANAALVTAKAKLNSAQAAVGQAQAQRDFAQKQVNRYTRLMKSNAISQQELDQARSNLEVQESSYRVATANVATANAGIHSAEAQVNAAKASVASAQAGVENAKINLSYTQINAPISGIIGVSSVSEGAYVSASQTKMAEIQQLDPLYVNITQSASDIIKLQKAHQIMPSNAIQLLYNDGTPYPYTGQLLFVNQMVNESTGEVTIRAIVPNPENTLLPGLYMRVHVPQERLENAFLIPQQAVTRGDTDTVMIAEANGSYRPQVVTIGGQQGNDWIVTQGLTEGQNVIVNGMGQMAIIMGAPVVQTRPWTGNAPQTPQAPQQAPASTEGDKASTQTEANAPTDTPVDTTDADTVDSVETASESTTTTVSVVNAEASNEAPTETAVTIDNHSDTTPPTTATGNRTALSE